MKRIAIISFACVLAITAYANWRDAFDDAYFAQAAAGEPPLNIPNLIAHWKLNDNAANTNVEDSKGTHEGTATSNTENLYISGKINGAFDFSGSNYVTVPNSPDLFNNEGATYLAWIKTTNSVDGQSIFSGGIRMILLLVNGKLYTSPVGYVDLYGTTPVNDGVWHHVGFRNEGGVSWTLYLDGEIDATSGNSGISNEGQPFIIAYYADWQPHLTYCLDGDLDDVRVYNRALTQAEIQQIYNNGNGTEAQ